VLKAIRRLGYERNALAGSLRTDRTYTVILVIPDITNPFWPEVARGVQDRLENEGYTAVLANSDWNARREHEFLAKARRNRFDGIIINPSAVTNKELVEGRVPTAILGLGTEYPDFDMVGSDSYGGTTLAMEHLYSLGHRRIGLISGISRRSSSASRVSSYVDFLRRQGIEQDEELIASCAYEEEAGKRSMARLLALDSPPTAVFAANDILAIGAMQAAKEAGLRVPADVSIVGMDDIHAVSVTSPPLTTVAKQKYESGSQAAAFLLERIRAEAPEGGRQLAFRCRLIARGSTAPPGQLR
jgi:DNA-binding LacI/PurR family transcriptional regulator